MGATRKIVIGLGLAGSALLAGWYFRGDRGQKARRLIAKKAGQVRQALKKVRDTFDDSEPHYV